MEANYYVACYQLYTAQVYPLKVLLRVQNMRGILKRSTFYNL